jgi:branched-subunit amino acid transport protein
MNKPSGSFWLSTRGLAALGLIAAASYFLLVEYREHLLAFLPYAILLACPFMHLFMHHGHGHHGVQSQEKERYKALRLHD